MTGGYLQLAAKGVNPGELVVSWAYTTRSFEGTQGGPKTKKPPRKNRDGLKKTTIT